jgi:hypothetical protein
VSLTVLQLCIHVRVAEQSFADIFSSVVTHNAAQLIAATPGLRWKIWLHNEEAQEIGGCYLFEDGSYIPGYLENTLPGLERLPFVSHIEAKQFAVAADMTLITRGPIPRHIEMTV